MRSTGVRSVLVVDGRIAAVGRVPASRARELPVYDGRGRTLVPGLIDGHTHALEPAREARDRNDALRLGTTTELSLFGDPRSIPAARRQRRSLARTRQADLWSAGNGISVPGGWPMRPETFPAFSRLGPNDDADRFVGARIGRARTS